MRLALVVISGFMLSAADAAGQQDSAEVRRLFDGSIAAAERSDFPTAIAMTDSLLAIDATIPSALWNLGVWHARQQEFPQALSAWKSLRSLDSTDWQVEAKLIQTYQALGDSQRRDSALAGLLAHRLVTKNPGFLEAKAFCREQATLEGRQVMALQAFEPQGERKVFVVFYLLGADGRDTARFSLGSYDGTTAIARQVGQIREDESIYHLDYYAERFHITYAFLRAQPSYDELRSMVVRALRGELEPLSSSTAPP